MKTTILFLIVLGLSLINAPSVRAFGFNDQPNIVSMTNYAPENSVDVTLTNDGGADVCNSCPTWYISVWEWDGNTGYQQIGSPKTFSSGPNYKWTGLTWDYTNYPCLVLIWHYVDTNGDGGCGYSTPDQHHSQCWTNGNPQTTWSVSDFYPC
jgi:hypothetical protein